MAITTSVAAPRAIPLRYTGTKNVIAAPMTRGEYNAYRGWTVPIDEDPTDPGYLVEYEDGGKANDPRHKGYISWSPADVFERSYRVIDESKPKVTASITGYRQLSQEEQLLINLVKQHAETTRELVASVQKFIADHPTGVDHTQVTNPGRWASIAQTHLQEGYMALVRSIAQPTTF